MNIKTKIFALGLILALTMPAIAQEADVQKTREETLKVLQEVVSQAKANVEQGIDATAPMQYPVLIQSALDGGAKIEFLGNYQGFTGWLMMVEDAPSYIYISADEKTVFRGLLFDGAGETVTLKQVAAAQIRNPEFFGLSKEDVVKAETDDKQKATDGLLNALKNSNFFVMGSTAADAPVLYAFLDPECAYCKKFLTQLNAEYLSKNTLQLRVVPIGSLSNESEAKAAYLLAQSDPAAAWLAHDDGSKPAPAQAGIELNKVRANLDLFQQWQFGGTPILVFQDKTGELMMVRGAPKNIAETIAKVGKAQ